VERARPGTFPLESGGSPPSDTRLYSNICEGGDRAVDELLARVVFDL